MPLQDTRVHFLNGHQHDSHSLIIENLKDCKAVVSRGMGRRLYEDLISAGIEVYVSNEIEVDKAVELYIKGELINLLEILH